MPCCVLRVDGAEFDPDSFLAASDLVADTIYRRGERRSANSVHTSSGFTAVVSDADGNHFSRQVQEAVEYLRANAETLVRLRGFPGVTAVLLDFGCDFPAERVTGRYYRLPLSLLTECTALGVEIELSVYVTR